MSTDDTSLSESGREDAASDRPSALLSQISNEMVRAQKEFFGRGPTKVKSYPPAGTSSPTVADPVDPNIVIEIFFFDASASPEDLKGTVEGQLGDDSHGEASEELTEPAGD